MLFQKFASVKTGGYKVNYNNQRHFFYLIAPYKQEFYLNTRYNIMQELVFFFLQLFNYKFV